MIKIIQAMRRSPSLSMTEFFDLYRKEHVQLILQYYSGLLGFVCDLAENRPLNPNHMGPNFQKSPYDGVASLYFKNLEDYLDPVKLNPSPDIQKRFIANQHKLFKEIHVYHVEEIVHWDNLKNRKESSTSPGFKIIPFSCRASRIRREEFFEHYREIHARLAREHHPGISRYVQNFIIDRIGDNIPEIDTTAELHFASFEDYRDKFYGWPESPKIIGKDVAAYADLKKLHFMTSVERVIKEPYST